MHTFIILAIGFGILAASLGVGLAVGESRSAVSTAALVFLPIWFLGAGINFWIGVSKAGYAIKDEMPIFLIVFTIPAIAALAVWWRFRVSN